MTRENEPARPDPADQPTPTNPAEQPTPGLTFVEPIEIIDPDERELIEARAAVKAEEAAVAGAAQTAPVTGTEPAQQPTAGEPAAPGQQPPPETPMIPKPRLDEALGRVTQAEQAAAYWRGVAEARMPPASQPGQQQAPQPVQQTPQERIAAIRSEVSALAKKFDDGEITYHDLKQREAALTDQVDAIREEALLAKVQPAQRTQAANDELYLDQLTAQIEKDHPWVTPFDQLATQTEWDFIKARGIENLVARGIDPSNGSIGKYELRREMATLIDQLAPTLIADRAQRSGITLPGQTTAQAPNQQQQQGLSPQAKALQAKLQLQQQAPPNLAGLPRPADAGDLSESRIEQMSEEEYDALPATTRNKLLGITA